MEKTAFKLMFNKSRTMVLEIQNNIAGYCKNTFFLAVIHVYMCFSFFILNIIKVIQYN